MTLTEFETTISAGERPQTYALERADSGAGKDCTFSWYNERCTFDGESPRNE